VSSGTSDPDRFKPNEFVASQVLQSAHQLLTWQSDRLIATEARASTVVGISLVLVPLGAISFSEPDAPLPRVLSALSLLVALAVGLLATIGVLRSAKTAPAPNIESFVDYWKNYRFDEEESSASVSNTLAEMLLIGKEGSGGVLLDFRDHVSHRVKRFRWSLDLVMISVVLLFLARLCAYFPTN
jgi:hypothetical protein